MGDGSAGTAQAGAEASADDDAAREYTLDDIAFASGVPSRTIRFYQFKGVLPGPVRRGRVALYDDRHLARLRQIGELKDRGLSLRTVRHLLDQDSGDARLLKSCLGLVEGLDRPWSDDRPATAGHAELAQIVGDERPGTIASLVEFGVVEREDGAGTAYRIPSPGLLRTTLALQQGGIDIATAARAGAILRRHLGAAARALVDHFTRGVGRGSVMRSLPAALDPLRPLAGEAASLIFAREIERALRRRFASSGARRSSHRSRRKARVR